MKRPLSALLLCCLSLGCVTGPEEVAAEKKAKEMASPAKDQVAELAEVKETPEGEAGVMPASGEESIPASEGFKKTSNGLKYKIIEPGTGKKPTARSKVVCHYRGWLDNGKEFDSSYNRGEPAEFGLDGVIPGWTEGLQLIKEGGKIELEIPSRLGYGERGMPGAIPPNARLHFTVELLKVKS